MAGREETEVLVVGAGPVGLMTALRLAERGVKVQIIDKDWRTTVHSYALALHSGTLRLLDEVGLAADLVEQGYRIDRVGVYRGDARAGEIDLSALGGSFPFVLVAPQSALETALENGLEERGVQVLWNHKAMGLESSPDGVTAEIARMDRVASGYPVARTEWVITKTFRTRASFVVGADGYDSMARRAIGAEYADLGGVETYAVFEFEHPEDLRNEVRLALDDLGGSVLWPMKEGKARWSFQVREVPNGAPRGDDLGKLAAERAPWFQPVPEHVLWSTSVWFERRLSDAMGRHRIWLAGDAAHLTGPIGAQSMNVGIREAGDLADRLAEILRGGAGPEGLDAYANERRQEWSRLLGIEGRLSAGQSTPDWARDLAPRLLPCIPASGADLDRLLGQIGLRFD